MHLTSDDIRFIQKHLNDDTNKLILAASKFPNLDIPFLADQILARKQIKSKLPYWYGEESLIFPSRIAAEQCSSESTAEYKLRLVKGKVVCDLTGGLGVDSYYLSKQTVKSYYIERFENYCDAARNNFAVLGANHIEVLQGDSREILPSLDAIDTIYVDPARRSDVNKRLFALEDCEPNILAMKESLLTKAKRLIIKISPMADVRLTMELLPETTEVHVISVKNECKELLFVLDAEKVKDDPVQLFCINFNTSGEEESFSFTRAQENHANPAYATGIKSYLYEPNASVLKAGAFKRIATHFGIEKLQINSHLYTSDELIMDFPGRIFKTEETFDFASKNIKKLNKSIPKANITVRNFPLSVEDIRKKTGIKEGGEIYLFATTLGKDLKVLVKGSKCK